VVLVLEKRTDVPVVLSAAIGRFGTSTGTTGTGTTVIVPVLLVPGSTGTVVS
jgi:hypothetical protein